MHLLIEAQNNPYLLNYTPTLIYRKNDYLSVTDLVCSLVSEII